MRHTPLPLFLLMGCMHSTGPLPSSTLDSSLDLAGTWACPAPLGGPDDLYEVRGGPSTWTLSGEGESVSMTVHRVGRFHVMDMTLPDDHTWQGQALHGLHPVRIRGDKVRLYAFDDEDVALEPLPEAHTLENGGFVLDESEDALLYTLTHELPLRRTRLANTCTRQTN